MYQTFRVDQPKDAAVFVAMGEDTTKKHAARRRSACEQFKGCGGFKFAVTYKDGRPYRRQENPSPVN
jgi:hypothetical protein